MCGITRARRRIPLISSHRPHRVRSESDRVERGCDGGNRLASAILVPTQIRSHTIARCDETRISSVRRRRGCTDIGFIVFFFPPIFSLFSSARVKPKTISSYLLETRRVRGTRASPRLPQYAQKVILSAPAARSHRSVRLI